MALLKKPGVPKTLARQRCLRHVCLRPRHGSDLDDEHAEFIYVPDIATINHGCAAFLPVHPAGGRNC